MKRRCISACESLLSSRKVLCPKKVHCISMAPVLIPGRREGAQTWTIVVLTSDLIADFGNLEAMVNAYLQSLLAGSAAGTAVDVILFPLDTIKTRLQSANGFWKTGGFSGIYRGLGPAFVGSAPNAAIFFLTYDSMKEILQRRTGQESHPYIHMSAAASAEVAACLVRVPVEIVKQRRQASGKEPVGNIVSEIRRREGFLGFYRGYTSTILREIPFSIIQFPLWEFLKIELKGRKGADVTAAESSLCGAIAGGISACLTTPLDVAKTRIMLADASSVEARGEVLTIWRLVYDQKGFRGLFAGAVPRTLWISVGGAIFFGTYELVKSIL